MISSNSFAPYILDKGAKITYEDFNFSPSRFKLYSSQRRRFNLQNIPFDGFSDVEIAAYERFYSRRRQNLRTLSKRFDKGVQEYDFCYFLTLTFDDDHLRNCSAPSRRDGVARFLKENFPFYVANIDFGEENGREHYHALVFTDSEIDGIKVLQGSFAYISNHNLFYRFGFIKVQPVYNAANDKIALSKYINKLKYHSTKGSTRFCKPIYSRKRR